MVSTMISMEDFIDGIELQDEQAATTALITPEQVATVVNQQWRPTAPTPWNPRLTFDIALKEDQQVLCDRYNISQLELEDLYYIPAFRREIADHQKQIREEGVTFRQKAKVQAEMYLEVLDDIVNDADVSAATRLDAIKSVVKWGDLEPKESKGAAANNQPQFNIQINL